MKKIYCTIAVILAAVSVQSCKESWLEPEALSFYSPENTLVDLPAVEGVLSTCAKYYTQFYFGEDQPPFCTVLDISDVAVIGKSDAPEAITDLDARITPSHLTADHNGKPLVLWTKAWQGIQCANLAISRLETIKDDMDEDEYKSVLGQAYFFRSLFYFNLVNEFGDVPWYEGEISDAKLDFNTYSRWSILGQLEKDMSYAYQNIPAAMDRGKASKWSAAFLYMKILMSNQKFDDAITVGKAIIAANPMVTEPLSSGYKNLMLDFNSYDTKTSTKNTEGLFYVMSFPEYKAYGALRSFGMRNGSPYWANGCIKTPGYYEEDGTYVASTSGTQNYIKSGDPDKDSYLDNDYFVGRGIGVTRPSNYYQYDVWTDAEKNDLRAPFNHDSWRHMEDLYYNKTTLRGKNKYYGQHLVRPSVMTVSDSMRCWFSWPHYKLYEPDPNVSQDRKGGECPWYVYRTAEVYLLVAECYYWKGDLSNEMNYINPVRERAGADRLASVTGMKEILDERARELYWEEWRHDELARIAFTYAKTGKSCEIFGGRVYTMDKFSGNTRGENLKAEGYNFFWDWVNMVNGIYNRGVILGNYGEYKISVHHVLLPVLESVIVANTQGTINQTPGYVSSTAEITPLTIGAE